MKKILLVIVTLFISDMAYSQVQRGNNFQRRGTVYRDQVRERLEMRRESVQSGEIDPLRILNLTEEQRKSFKEINSKHLSAVKPIKKEMMKKKLEMQLEKMEDKLEDYQRDEICIRVVVDLLNEGLIDSEIQQKTKDAKYTRAIATRLQQLGWIKGERARFRIDASTTTEKTSIYKRVPQTAPDNATD